MSVRRVFKTHEVQLVYYLIVTCKEVVFFLNFVVPVGPEMIKKFREFAKS